MASDAPWGATLFPQPQPQPTLSTCPATQPQALAPHHRPQMDLLHHALRLPPHSTPELQVSNPTHACGQLSLLQTIRV